MYPLEHDIFCIHIPRRLIINYIQFSTASCRILRYRGLSHRLALEFVGLYTVGDS